LHLGWLSFEGDVNVKGYETDAFRAHEVSHQWWGHIVGWKSYHDQWLSEGFAEYTSAWFMQTKDGDNKRFFNMLDAWKDQITQKGGGSGRYWQEGSTAGPVWLGYRLSSTKSNDYYNLVYAKGGYVMHMLRMILFDYNKNSDDRFIELMRNFIRIYSGKKASTTDFKNLTEKQMGMDMDWFFDQWVFGIDIPTYRNEYEVIEENGQYIVKANITQENVPDDFKMVVPLVVEFENKSHIVLKFWVEGPETMRNRLLLF
jgi:aminopeptidase N